MFIGWLDAAQNLPACSRVQAHQFWANRVINNSEIPISSSRSASFWASLLLMFRIINVQDNKNPHLYFGAVFLEGIGERLGIGFLDHTRVVVAEEFL
jgi:hypothetical protein